MTRVTVLAATGRLGQALVRRLLADGVPVIAVGRTAGKLGLLPATVETRLADLGDPMALAAALADARLVVSCANASHVPAILAALPAEGVERLVVMGSTRRFSAVPDDTADAVRAAEAALAHCRIPAVLLLATLIYGAGGSVVDGLARQIRRFPLLPLPGGGKTLVQPIHIDDVAASLAAALVAPKAPGTPIVIAGPQPMTYREMVYAIARARGLNLMVIPIPVVPVMAMARMAGMLDRFRGMAGSVRRLLEDKSFDITEMRQRLGVEPRGFEPGSGGKVS
jgi:uncharacterized protein YbjT (DUF2867 family)